jgi:hypothetical protein
MVPVPLVSWRATDVCKYIRRFVIDELCRICAELRAWRRGARTRQS